MFKNEVIEALKVQKEIFGDDLFTERIEVKLTKKQEPAKEVKTESTSVEFQSAKDLNQLNSMISGCLKCRLGKTRKNFVFGVGNPDADIMFVGEGPGADEDEQGEPFVGRAGKLLNDIIAAIKLKREDVYIANIVKCRPPANRVPEKDEMECCIPYLQKQIELVKPKYIVCLGATAALGLLNHKGSLASMRQKFHEYMNTKVLVTYHPAALLRNANYKRPTWEDFKMLRRNYDEEVLKQPSEFQ